MVRLCSFNYLNYGGILIGSPFSGFCQQYSLLTVALLEALLLDGHTWQVVCIMVLYLPHQHHVMVEWAAYLVVIADGTASTELPLCFVNSVGCSTAKINGCK